MPGYIRVPIVPVVQPAPLVRLRSNPLLHLPRVAGEERDSDAFSYFLDARLEREPIRMFQLTL
jgi:hypothetical protein